MLLIENYLKGVLPREVPASWGNAGGGAGMNALWAMAVAARSFAHSQGRYTYAQTCDTATCQVYGGARPPQPVSRRAPDSVCAEPSNASFECSNTNRAVRDDRERRAHLARRRRSSPASTRRPTGRTRRASTSQPSTTR